MDIHIPAGNRFVGTLGAIVIAVAVGTAAAATPTHAQVRAATPARNATTSLHFHKIPVRSALQLIAEEGHFNLVVPDSVQGTITLRLRDVTWEEALDVVLRLKGLQRHVDSATRSVTVTD
jgi:type IV pilus assembly protein PilQ